uniref:Retrovirus-related Pol polyprotein from transposon TNT 1-94-like beta-barrel domain-containing protein n=1 Tax=Physcomitrium patens TaxID=3218 RepID=A0A2K1JZJ1_PHYPA|nr:hypothetical protein PHYPA_014061 [Physcomitrium patens]
MKEGNSVIKYIYTCETHLKQLIVARSIILDDEAILTLMRSLPQKRFVKYAKSEDKQVFYFGNDSTSFIIIGYGNVNIKLINGDEKIILDAFYLLKLAKNLFSIKQLDKTNKKIYIKDGEFTLMKFFCLIIGTCKLNLDLNS